MLKRHTDFIVLTGIQCLFLGIVGLKHDLKIYLCLYESTTNT